MTPWLSLLDWFGLLRDQQIPPDEAPREGEEGEVELFPWRLRAVGAWVGRATILSAAETRKDLAFARKLGLGRLDVVINDHSRAHLEKDPERPFDTYNKDRIIAFCKEATAQGFDVHLMTWVMPHGAYLRQAGEQLADLYEKAQPSSIMLDAEEPWTRAKQPMPYEEAAELAAELLSPIPLGVTGIGYAPANKVGPLVRRAQYMVPQCYSTERNNLDPATACPHLVGRWRKLFGERELVVGLAGYAQAGRRGYSHREFMDQAFHAAEATEPTDIVYWSLRHFAGRSRTAKKTAQIISDLAKRAIHRAG